MEQPAGASDRARHEAFARYVVPEVEVLVRVATSITSRPVDAEDLMQDTLLRAFRSIESFDGRYPRARLLTIMRNAEVNRTRRRRPERPVELECRMESASERCAYFQTGPEFVPVLLRQRDHARDHHQPDRAALYDDLLQRVSGEGP